MKRSMERRAAFPRVGRACRRCGASAGVTLVEVLVAALILGLLAAGVFTALVFGQRTTTSSETRLLALAEAQRVAEQLREAITVDSQPVGELSLQAGTHPLTVSNSALPSGSAGYTVINGRFNAGGAVVWSTDPLNPVNDDAGNPIDEDNYDIKQVQITVAWTPPGAS